MGTAPALTTADNSNEDDKATIIDAAAASIARAG